MDLSPSADIELASLVFSQAEEGFAELARDPVLSVAAVLLMVVSLAWVIVARLITVNMRRVAARRLRAQGRRPPVSPKKMWTEPP